MAHYLSYKFEDTPEFVNTFDELPLWSASFGLLLLKYLEYKPNLTILDIGSGAGFPLMEIAGRFGSTCTCYGLDVWTNANNRAKQKIQNYGLDNVKVIEGSGDNIPFDNNSIDLIVSNLGINNFEQPEIVFKECNRVLKPGGKLALTTNINGHWKEFYNIFEEVATEAGNETLLNKIKADQERRGNTETISNLFTAGGMKVTRHYTESFEMKFTDGSAFLNHYFIKVGWLGSWMKMPDSNDLKDVFSALEERLNVYSRSHNGLTLTILMLYMEGVKQ